MERNEFDNHLSVFSQKRDIDMSTMETIFKDDALRMYRRYTIEFTGNIFDFYLHLPETSKAAFYKYILTN